MNENLDERTRRYYRDTGHGEVPHLDVGDRIYAPGEGVVAVVGFRAHGMLVDVQRTATSQVLCFPRFCVDHGFLRPLVAL